MKRYFYLSESLDDLEVVEEQLETRGIATPQIHVISHDDRGLDNHKLHQVHQWFQTDVIPTTIRGFAIGIVVAALVVGIACFAGLYKAIGMVPFIFLSIVLFGFITWEAGFIGTQRPNRYLKRFNKALDSGKHLLMVDVDEAGETVLREIVSQHPCLKPAGIGGGQSKWALFTKKKARDYLEWAP